MAFRTFSGDASPSLSDLDANFSALLDPAVLVNALGADNTGATESTAVIQSAIDAIAAIASGGRVVLRGTYLVDTLTLKTNVVLDMTAGAKLVFKPHATSHNPVIRIGTDGSAVSGAKILGGEIDGNASGQTYPSEEWSPGIMIWGSSDNVIDGVKIHNCKGDCITIGYDTGRVVGSNRNSVYGCELYSPSSSPARMCVAITYGNENHVVENKCSGVIDLELNASIGECKNNEVRGNKGRVTSESLGSPRVSDLVVSLASLNTDVNRYFGNIVTSNHCASIVMQYNKGTTVSDNVIVGSSSSQVRLVAIDGCEDTIFKGNQLNINAGVAVGITDAIRTRGCSGLQVLGNTCRGDASSRPFHAFINTFAASSASGHVFRDNQTESGYYRNGACQQPTEWARFRLDQTNGGAISLTQVAGVKCNAAVSRSGTSAVLTGIGNAGAQYIFDMLTKCNATTAGATDMTHFCSHTFTASGSNRTVSAWTHAPASGAVSLAAFSFSSAGGTGTFLIDAWF